MSEGFSTEFLQHDNKTNNRNPSYEIHDQLAA
jgi:hypothetical protein